MTDQRVEPRRWAVLLAVSLALGVPGQPRSEGVTERAKATSSRGRLRGAVTIRVVPGGLLALGGTKLRFQPEGTNVWRTVHEVRGDSLYRVDADERGRLLALWEEEPVIHLFDPQRRAHRTFPKPPIPPGYTKETHHSVSGVHFAEGGRAAIVYLSLHPWAYDTGTRHVTAAYRVSLDGAGRPELLFAEEGHPLHASDRGAAIVKPRNWKLGCSHNGCPVESILAVELRGGAAVRRTIFVPGSERVDSARIVRATYDDRFAVQIGSWDGKRHRRLLRHAYGGEPTLHDLSDPSLADFEAGLLARNGDYVEAGQASDRSVTVTRLTARGEESSVRIVPWADARGRPARDWFHSLGERKDGSLWLHWGDQLVVGDPAAARRLDVGDHVGRGTEWAKAYVYEEDPEILWMGVEVGGGRDYAAVALADVERRALAWQPPTVDPGARSPMPPSVASRLAGTRREHPVGDGVVSIGTSDLYHRARAGDPWRLLYAVPDRSIYRVQVDERRGRILAQWDSERSFHLFEPGRGLHRTFPWPATDSGSRSRSLEALFFATDDHALVYLSGLVHGGPRLTEAYRVRLDGAGAPRRVLRGDGNPLDLSARGATFALPTKTSGYQCDTVYCIVDRIVAFSIDGDDATERVVFQNDGYTDCARRVPGTVGDGRAVVIRSSLPGEQGSTRGRTERVLLHFRYGARGVERTVLPAWTTDAVKRAHLTEAGDYLEFVVGDDGALVIELLGRTGARATWRVRAPRNPDQDSVPDRDVHGFGERSGGGYWLHWGDQVLLLRDGPPLRAFSLARYLAPRAEWAGADRYTASPETLHIGVDVGAGREFVDLDLATIEKGATALR